MQVTSGGQLKEIRIAEAYETLMAALRGGTEEQRKAAVSFLRGGQDREDVSPQTFCETVMIFGNKDERERLTGLPDVQLQLADTVRQRLGKGAELPKLLRKE